MKELFWKRTSFILTIILVVMVTSWATGSPPYGKKDKKGDATEEDLLEKAADQGIVLVEGDKSRYVIFGSGSRPTENDKIILYDSWDLTNSQDIWILKDPHTDRSRWTRMSFEKR